MKFNELGTLILILFYFVFIIIIIIIISEGYFTSTSKTTSPRTFLLFRN